VIELLLGIPLVLLLIAAAFDLRTREIPDWIGIAIIVLAVIGMVFGLDGIRWWSVLGGGLAGFGIGYGLFRFANLGGGDAKLIGAIGTLLGPIGILIVLFWMALAGGLLALIAAARGQRDYAYGPAIALGYLAYLIWPVGIWQRLIHE